MNSEQIKRRLRVLNQPESLDYILALEAERDAERGCVSTRSVHGTLILGLLVEDRIGDPKILVLHQARARVDSFKPKEATDATADGK